MNWRIAIENENGIELEIENFISKQNVQADIRAVGRLCRSIVRIMNSILLELNTAFFLARMYSFVCVCRAQNYVVLFHVFRF